MSIGDYVCELLTVFRRAPFVVAAHVDSTAALSPGDSWLCWNHLTVLRHGAGRQFHCGSGVWSELR